MEGPLSIKSTFLFLSYLYLVNCVNSELSSEECLALGYNRESLVCSSCELLDKFEVDFLKSDCLQCCKADDHEKNAVKKYPKAKLEICHCNLGSFPQVQAFVKSDLPGKFPNLQVKHVQGQKPQVKLLNADGSVADTMSIKTWNTETIIEFFETYLEQPAERDSLTPDSIEDNGITNEI